MFRAYRQAVVLKSSRSPEFWKTIPMISDDALLKKNICLVVPKGNQGGAQRYVYLLSKLLAKKGSKITVIHGEGDSLGDKLSYIDNINVRRFESYSNKSLIPDIYITRIIYNKLKAQEIDVVLFNSTKSLLPCFILSFTKFRKNLIFAAHGFPWFPDDKSFKGYLKEIIFKLLLSRIDNIIAVSNFVYQTIERLNIGNKNIKTILNTLDLSHAMNLVPVNLGQNTNIVLYSIHGISVAVCPIDRPLRAVSLAELVPNKGIVPMCHGIAEFSSKLKGQFIWEIFGDGDERKKIEDIITQSNLSDIVFLKGFSPSASEEIKNYDMLIIPSVNEAFGMVALEAAASGVYVVANAVGGISEAIGPKENGIVLPGHREISVFIAGLVEGGMKPVTSNNNSLSFWKERQDDWMEKHIKFIYNI